MVAIPKLESSAAVLKSRVARWGSSAGTVVPSKVRFRLAGLAFRARSTSLGASQCKRAAPRTESGSGKRARSAWGPAKSGDVTRPRYESVTVDSQQELHACKLDSKALQKSVPAIAFGLRTVSGHTTGQASSSAASQRAGFAHAPAIGTPAKMHFTPDFCKKHPRLVKEFRNAIACTESKWQETSAKERGCTILRGLRECQSFLQNARAMPRVAGVHASFLGKNAKTFTGVSRFGRPTLTSSKSSATPIAKSGKQLATGHRRSLRAAQRGMLA